MYKIETLSLHATRACIERKIQIRFALNKYCPHSELSFISWHWAFLDRKTSDFLMKWRHLGIIAGMSKWHFNEGIYFEASIINSSSSSTGTAQHSTTPAVRSCSITYDSIQITKFDVIFYFQVNFGWILLFFLTCILERWQKLILLFNYLINIRWHRRGTCTRDINERKKLKTVDKAAVAAAKKIH